MVGAGRLLLSLLHVPLRHDMYVAAAGCYALWALARLIGWARSVVMSPSIAGMSRKPSPCSKMTTYSWLPQMLRNRTHCRKCFIERAVAPP